MPVFPKGRFSFQTRDPTLSGTFHATLPGKLLHDRSQDLAEDNVRLKFDQPWITGL